MAFSSLTLWTTGCSDDDYPDVDGQSPSVTFTTTHVQSAIGRTFTIEGTATDADGISTIQLVCADLYLDKTIDLIDIYGEPLTSYELSYDFTTQADELGERFVVTVTVTDVGGRTVTQDITVTMDGDFSVPVFVSAPANESTVTVLLTEGVAPSLTLNVSVSDDRALDYLTVDIEGLSDSPVTVDLGGATAYSYSGTFALPEEQQEYPLTLTLADKVGNIVTRTATIAVSELQDFESMYLADVATDSELNSDVFGVPMLVDHTGEYEYTALYYNQAAGTEVYLLAQDNSFSPICFGVDASDSSALTYDTNNMNPLVLTEANVYYKIVFNTLEQTYETSTYSTNEAQDPWGTEMTYGTETMDVWSDGSTFATFTFGITSSSPSGVESFTQDSTNPHLFYSEPMVLSAGDTMNFIITNYHQSGWWNKVRWCSTSETDLTVFGYYTQSESKNPAYTGPTNVKDVWSKPEVTTSGTYRFWFDSHLGRAKLVQEN
ncbi:MAG: hypothetical protein Q4D56_10060 [Bacteroides sp.]|nr:hypothetical protein [Bacteroides sp.]